MPKLHYGSRGGVYYKRKGRKVYINRFGLDNEEIAAKKEFLQEIAGVIARYINNPSPAFNGLREQFDWRGGGDNHPKKIETKLMEMFGIQKEEKQPAFSQFWGFH